jgi:hypothetical protein
MLNLPNDVCRCVNIYCEKLDKCARHSVHYKGNDHSVVPIFNPNERDCHFFIDGGNDGNQHDKSSKGTGKNI